MSNNLDRVIVLVKTFLRDGYLYDCLSGLEENLPEVSVLVVDDGRMTPVKERAIDNLESFGGKWIMMPFDSGFGAKSNEAIRYLNGREKFVEQVATVFDVPRRLLPTERPYLLIGSDDFDFRPKDVREGIIKLVGVLDNAPTIGIASGRVNGRPYEYMLEDKGEIIIEHPVDYTKVPLIKTPNNFWYHPVDLTVNYSLIRRNLLGFGARPEIHWDDDVKIGGGEHGAFFVDALRADIGVAIVPDVNIFEQVGKPVSAEYSAMRGRARRPERESFKKRGIKTYVCGGGSVERVP